MTPLVHRVLRRMKEDRKLSRIPALVMTGAPSDVPPDILTMTKPFDDERLLTTVGAIIGPPYRRPPTPVSGMVRDLLLDDASDKGARS